MVMLLGEKTLQVKEIEYKGKGMRVYEDGTIIFTDTGKKANVINSNGYKAIYFMESPKKQVTVYIHRLLAVLYVDKPKEECDVVKFKDGNKDNIHINNLEWSTVEDIFEEVRRNGGTDPTKNLEYCSGCGENKVRGNREDKLCYRCVHDREIKEGQKERLKELQRELDWYMNGLEYATPKQQEVILERYKGRTFQEIGDELGISRQAVEQRIQKARVRIERAGRKMNPELFAG